MNPWATTMLTVALAFGVSNALANEVRDISGLEVASGAMAKEPLSNGCNARHEHMGSRGAMAGKHESSGRPGK